MLKQKNIHEAGLRDTQEINGKLKHVANPNQWGEFRHIALADCVFIMRTEGYRLLSRDILMKVLKEYFAMIMRSKFPKATHVFEYRLITTIHRSTTVAFYLVGNVYEHPYTGTA